MTARLHVPLPLGPADSLFDLPDAAARHAQVLRMQPGTALVLFDGTGGEWTAEVTAMGRHSVQVRLGTHTAVDRELPVAVTLAVGMPANERMDTLVEKATELGVARIQPLLCERSVLRVKDDRAERKVARWRDIAASACEQSGRTVLPVVEPVRSLSDFLAGTRASAPADEAGGLFVLSPRAGAAFVLPAMALATTPATDASARPAVVFLSGPEGGLSPAEEDAALRAGYRAVQLGPRVLRADTAPLAVLAAVGLAGLR